MQNTFQESGYDSEWHKKNIFEESITASYTFPPPGQKNDKDFTPFLTFPIVEKEHATEWLY